MSLPIRIRKLIGAVALICLVVYGRCSRWRSPRRARIGEPRRPGALLRGGRLGWVLPAMPLISWMSRPD